MKSIIYILLITISDSTFGQIVSFKDYFPLKNETIHTFQVSHITSADTIRDKNDLSICRSLLINGKEIFYFSDKLNDNIDDNEIIGSQAFCDGVFYYDQGNFVFSPIFWKNDLKKANLDYFDVLFPERISFDTIYKYQDGEEKRKYKFNGFENVDIKGRLFENCLKLTIIQDWKTAQYIDTVWFFKGVGVIKWLRGTGRLEEIKL
jgi:hypothetical protein